MRVLLMQRVKVGPPLMKDGGEYAYQAEAGEVVEVTSAQGRRWILQGKAKPENGDAASGPDVPQADDSEADHDNERVG